MCNYRKLTSKFNIRKNSPSHCGPRTHVWLTNIYLDKDDPWSGILAATDFSVRSTYHTFLQATPRQLDFGRDMIFNTPCVAYWKSIRLHKQKMTDKNNPLEHKNHKPHIYSIQDKVLVRNKKANKYENPYVGPYPITKVWNNGNVTICRCTMKECINIIWIKPYNK